MARRSRDVPQPQVSWRPLRESDLEDVAALEAQIHAAPWTIGNFRDALAAGYACASACVKNRIVAYGVLMLGPGERRRSSTFRRARSATRGIGTHAASPVVDDARWLNAAQIFSRCARRISLRSRSTRTKAFAPVARRLAYYPGPRFESPREDALVMRRALARVTGRPAR
jgi:hypothetical protein